MSKNQHRSQHRPQLGRTEELCGLAIIFDGNMCVCVLVWTAFFLLRAERFQLNDASILTAHDLISKLKAVNFAMFYAVVLFVL